MSTSAGASNDFASVGSAWEYKCTNRSKDKLTLEMDPIAIVYFVFPDAIEERSLCVCGCCNEHLERSLRHAAAGPLTLKHSNRMPTNDMKKPAGIYNYETNK